MFLAMLFEKLNSRHAGHITVNQLATWICPTSRMLEESGTDTARVGVASLPITAFFTFAFSHAAAIFPFIGKLVACEKEYEMTVDEFIVIVNNLCTMNEEEFSRHVFHCMASGRDAHGERYVNLSTLEDRCAPAAVLTTSPLLSPILVVALYVVCWCRFWIQFSEAAIRRVGHGEPSVHEGGRRHAGHTKEHVGAPVVREEGPLAVLR